jgi:hypothetical protein
MMRQTSCSTYILLCLTVTVGGPTGEESLTGKKTSARRGGLHVTNTKFTNYAINSLTQSDPIHSTRHISLVWSSARPHPRSSARPLLRYCWFPHVNSIPPPNPPWNRPFGGNTNPGGNLRPRTSPSRWRSSLPPENSRPNPPERRCDRAVSYAVRRSAGVVSGQRSPT